MTVLSKRFEEGFFRSAIESSLDCIYVLDPEGCIRLLNASGAALMDVEDVTALKGRAWASLWPERTRPQAERALAAGLRGEPSRFEGDAPTLRGSMKHWEVVVAPLSDRAGRVEGLLATCRDVTAAVLARHDKELRSRGQAKTAGAFRSANRIAQLGGWEYDIATQTVRFSSDLVDLLGGGGAPMDYSEAVKFLIEEDRAPFADQLQDAVAFGREFTFEGRFLGPEGDLRWLRIQGEPELAQGWCVAMRGASQDITEWHRTMDRLRESERTATQATEAMSSFLTNMSHELRTPLNGVLGMAEVMTHGALPDFQRERLRVIQSSGQTLLIMLNDLLDLTKIKAGKAELQDGVVCTESLADSVKAFSALAQEKGLSLNVHQAPDACGEWSGDHDRIRQVLHNLIANAVKFTDRGAVDVYISAEADRLVLQVKDTGIGIAQDKQARIFDRFVQADSSMTRRHGGCGLAWPSAASWSP